MNTATPILVSRKAAAELYGSSVETIKRLERSGRLVPVRLTPRAHPRYRLSDLLELAGERVSDP